MNGWNNEETHAVVSVIDNDEYMYDTLDVMISERELTDSSDYDELVSDVIDEIREFIEEDTPDKEMNGFGELTSELLNCAIDRVDFTEIAEAWIKDRKDLDGIKY